MDLKTLKKMSYLAYAFAILFTGLSLGAKPNHSGLHSFNSPPMFSLTDELKQLRDELKEEREALSAVRKSAIEALADDATKEDKRAAIKAFRLANSEAIADLKAQSKELRDNVKAYIESEGIVIPERPNKGFTKEQIRQHVREHKKKHKEKREAFLGLKEEAIQALTESGLTEPSKKEIREKIKEIVAERKADATESNEAAENTARAD